MDEPILNKKLALVIGGGGSAGHAWTIGLAAGLARANIDLAHLADLTIGTSSGSTAAAHLLSGIPAGQLFESILAEPRETAGQKRPHAARTSHENLFERLRALGAAATSSTELIIALGSFGISSDAGFTAEERQQRRTLVESRLPNRRWPERELRIVAVNAHTGELVTFGRNSGVDLVDAILAATALPGLAPTHQVDGHKYINGGVRSADNADLATGYQNVIVVSPFGGRTGAPTAGQFEGIRRFPGEDLAGQVEKLRRDSTNVVVITPDAESQNAMGTNQMDPATRIPSARAGFAQGEREAARLLALNLG